MKKILLLVFAVVLWVAAIIFMTLIVSFGPPGEVTSDLSELRAGQVIAGTNIVEADFDCSYEAFIDRSYRFDVVLAGIDKDYSHSKLIYMGREIGWEGDQWYRAERKIEGLGWFPAAKEVRVAGQTLTILYGKDKGATGRSIFLIILFMGGSGAILFSRSRKQ